MTVPIRSIPFRENAAKAVRNESLRQAMRYSTDVFMKKRAEGIANLPMEAWREKASAIRTEVLQNLREYLEQFSAAAEKAGAKVHFARDAALARQTMASILTRHAVKKIVKAKSMVTEEIHLNQHLESLGMEVTETDLGEYIVQLAGEKPSHILAPAIHKNRYDIGRLLADKLGVEYSHDPEVLTKVARRALRAKFLAADAGITGANFAVAETGTIVIFTNEGNGRMVTTLPPLHIAVLTIEKIIPTLSQLGAFSRLLARGATGQPLSSYLSVITGTRKPGEATGAQELHIVFLDNGRFDILEGEYWEILKCIRCSACFNTCPVYRVVGGHAYEATYSGPMGMVLTALLEGMDRAHPLLDATTLCGACTDVCPVKIPLTSLFTRLREQRAEMGLTSLTERKAMAAFGMVAGSPALFSLSQRLSRLFWPVLSSLVASSRVDRLPRPTATPFSRKT
jgi:L-lactate dehydrogenase complex protein LldF